MVATYLSLVITMFFWGGTFIAGRMLAGSVSPVSSAFFRFAIASCALLVLARIIDGRIALPPRHIWGSIFVLGLSGVFGYNILFFTGLKFIEAGRASLIIALNPLAITIFAALFFKEKLSLKQFAGILVSLSGAVFVISNGHPDQIFSGSLGVGELAILGCVASWATYSLVGRKVLAHLPPLTTVFYSSVVGTILLMIPTLATQELQAVSLYPHTAWMSLFFLGILGTAAGFSMYYYAIRKIGASRAGVFINLVPFFSILLSSYMLSEEIKPSVLIGGILILFGVTMTNWAGRSREAK